MYTDVFLNWPICENVLFLIKFKINYCDVIMGPVASQITSLTIVYSTVYSDADQRKYQSPASLAFVRGIHRGPVNSPHKWPVTRKKFPFDDVIMEVDIDELIEHTTLCLLCVHILRRYIKDLFYFHDLTSMPAWISNHIQIKCGMKLVFHSQNSTVKSLKFWNV